MKMRAARKGRVKVRVTSLKRIMESSGWIVRTVHVH